MQQTTSTSNPSSPNLPSGKNVALLWSLAVIRAIGYVLLIFFFLEFIDTVLPPRFTNPGWEFQTLGRLVESVPVLLFAFGMIYVGREIGRDWKERYILPAITWLALIIGIVYFLMIPLTILNTSRLIRINNQQMVQVQERKNQVNEIKTNLNKTKNQADFEKLLQGLGNTQPIPKLESPQQLEEIKKNFSNVVQGGENQLNTQTEQLKLAKFDLLKKSVKWNIGAFLSGFLLIYIWRIMRRRSSASNL